MSRDKFVWDGSYKLRDGTRTRKRSQGAYDAQKNGLFPIEEAATYISRALKISKEEAQDKLKKHRAIRIRQTGSSGDEWHHVGPAGQLKNYFDARELAVWRKLDNVNPNWARSIFEARYHGVDPQRGEGNAEAESSEIKRLAEATGLKEEKVKIAYSRMMQLVRHPLSDRELAILRKLDSVNPNWVRNIQEAAYRIAISGKDHDGMKNEIKLLAGSTRLKEEDIWDAYSSAKGFITSTELDEWRATFEKNETK